MLNNTGIVFIVCLADMPRRSIGVFVRVRCETDQVSQPGAESSTDATGAQLELTKHVSLFQNCATQEAVSRMCGLPLVSALFEGFDGCLFAYGQTGSGKTFSMLGRDGAAGLQLHDLDGVIPEAAREIFRRITRVESDTERVLGMKGMSKFEVRAKFIEVYRGQAYDLLRDRRAIAALSAMGGSSKGGDSAGDFALAESRSDLLSTMGNSVRVESALDLLALIQRGSSNRRTASTGQNDHSSRSHAVLSLTVEKRWVVDAAAALSPASSDTVSAERAGGRDDQLPCSGDGTPSSPAAASMPTKARTDFMSRTSRLMLVDLAGSESTSMAHGGSTDRSGTAVNLGLLALGQVCAALASGEKHVPYRNDMLTRLLEPALGGNCVTHMLACVSDAPGKLAESISTLRFGRRVASLSTDKIRAVDAATMIEKGPLDDDMEDPHPSLKRRTAWIQTRDHGDVFARMCGSPADPLLLYVHGSGPSNSSIQFNFCQDGVGRSHPGLFQVSIDCPGYGRTPGDKQTIRSYAGSFLREVVRSLGKTKAFSLIGSS